MALDTCGGLQEAVANWLARSGDSQITTNVADFIAMAEAHINRHLRVRQMETLSTITTTDGSTNLADDYLAWRSLTYVGDIRIPLMFMHPDMLDRFYPDSSAGVPANFTIRGSDLIVRPIDDDVSLEFVYYAKPDALLDDDDTNWLLAAHPDLYLSATLAEANAFLINPDHATLWAQKRDAIISQISILSEKTKGPATVIPIGTFY